MVDYFQLSASIANRQLQKGHKTDRLSKLQNWANNDETSIKKE